MHLLQLCILAALSPGSPADVLDVGGGTPDYSEIHAAVAAAANGDVIRVWPGSYQIFQVNGKALTIAATAPGAAQVLGAYRVMNLSADDVVAITGIASTGNDSEGALVVNCLGSVRFQDCTMIGHEGLQGTTPPPPMDGDGWSGVRVLGSNDVSFVRCELEGGAGALISCEFQDWYIGNGGSALSVEDSTVAFFDSVATGGYGGGSIDTTDTAGARGGHGVQATVSTVYVGGSELNGGTGGLGGDSGGFGYGGGDGGPGGDSIWAAGGVVRTLDVVLNPGAAGSGQGMGGPGVPGQPVRLSVGATLEVLSGVARHLTAPVLVTEATSLAFQVEGEVGDLVVAFTATDTRHVFDARLRAPLMVGTSSALPRFVVGTIDGSGSVVYAKRAPYQPPFQTTTWHVQAYARSTGGELFLTEPAVVTILDAAF
ncbi:MAG: hypothetical protein GY711_35545 [bacterium]|nr:hypothetical protein [bacterium]